MKIHFAPIQGFTDAPYRYLHHKLYGADVTYYTPFIRLEKGELRRKDQNDYFGREDLNKDIDVVPQIIFRDAEELNMLVDIMKRKGVKRLDLNMGCPFPLQTARGRGAATILNSELGDSVVEVIKQNPDVEFSVKMRLGLNRNDEWRGLLDKLNTVELKHITMHPRVAKQQYGGEPDMEMFAEFLKASKNPVVYNGDIVTPEDAKRIQDKFPEVAGIMIGRGMLGRPSLANEISASEEWDRQRRIETMKDFHRRLFAYYSETLQGGEHQVLSHIQPFWEYAQEEIGRKAWKSIRKATTLPKYHTALALIDTQ